MIEEELYDEPDFSGDDFANDKEIQKIRREREEHVKMIDESIAKVVSSLQLTKTSHVNLKDFSMFKNLQATLTESYESKAFSSPLRVSIAFYHTSTSVGRGRSSGDDLYFFGRLHLRTKFPATYICKESITEYIRDLIMNQETNFPEHKKFCRRFYVLSNDGHRLKQLLQLKSLDDLVAFRDMELELQDDYCLFRCSRRPVSPNEADSFVELAKTLSKVLT